MSIICSFLLIFNSLLFFSLGSPLTMGSMIIFQTLLISLLLYNVSFYSWFSFIILMVFISGVMVVFSYISSLASNNYFFFSTKNMSLLILFSLLLSLIFLPMNNYNTYFNLLSKSIYSKDIINLYKMYTDFPSMMTIILMIYLLIILIIVVKITNITQGPLKFK